MVAKPSGLFVHRSTLDATVRDVLLTRVRDALGMKVWPVHRLDRPTSGPVLFATTATAVPRLQEALATGEKTYLALVRGLGARLPAVIDRPLRPPERETAVPALTRFEVLGAWRADRCALVRARPQTGRFHQIRRHLAGAGHPVLMDSSHGDSRLHAAWRAKGLSRLFLHCARLRLPAEDIDAHCPLPADLKQVLASLGEPDEPLR